MILASNEHQMPVVVCVTYTTDEETDAFIRLYDGEVARRDEPWLIEKKHLSAHSPEALRDMFNLSFVPRYACDATIPAGESVTMALVRNARGDEARVFRANTRLILSNERLL
jgi:hypothetical protein